MIIECDQCNTKFRLDDSRISQNGVKVRCTKCQNVFIVTPPPPPEEVLVEEVFGPDTPFMAKGPDGIDSAGAGGPQGTDGAKQGSAAWGVFNSNEEGDINASAEKRETGDETRGLDDGKGEPPELSFGGPDFSSLSGLSGLSGQGTASGKETGDETPEEPVKETAEGPWFTGAADEDDGFPEDGPAEGPTSGETPFADELPPPPSDEPAFGEEETDEAPVEKGFDVSAPEEDGEEGVKTPFDEFDFGLDDDEQGDPENKPQGHIGDDWGAREEEAPADGIAGDAPKDMPEDSPEDPFEKTPADTYGEFSLTPPPKTPANQPESAAGEKVIPFSTGYNRNGKSAKAGGNEENRFEDLFTRALSEKDTEEPVEPETNDENEDLEFDRDEFLPESVAAPEEALTRHHYAAGKGLILVALIFILGAGAIYFSGIIDTLARTLTSTPRTEAVQIEAISGYVAANKNFGRFFVIEAKIKNTSDEAQIIDRITGIIYDDKGRSIATRSVSPGRVVAEDDLKNLTKAELLGRFSDSSGGVIPPKGTVPVMVPFTEIPAGLAEYGLKIIRE